MFTILNRLRGTWSWFSKVVAVVLFMLFYYFTKDIVVSILIGLGYVLGESFGWGLWVGTLTTQRENGYNPNEEEGNKYTGIQWLAKKLIKPTKENWLNHCRLALFFRGLWWWVPTLAPLVFVYNYTYVAIAIAVLSICFPLACEIGYKSTRLSNIDTKIQIVNSWLSDGWTRQELAYGLMQDIVIFNLIYWSITWIGKM